MRFSRHYIDGAEVLKCKGCKFITLARVCASIFVQKNNAL